jgi:uncharacterized protein DUF6438
VTARTRALLIGALAACSPPPPAGGPSPYDSTATATPVITLERTPCFGTCPVYQVSISRSGSVRFVGKHHVTLQGAASAEIAPARVDSLLRELEVGGYFDFADAYVMGSPACGAYATDSPTVITSVTSGGRTRAIRHDYGCQGAPRELARLERLIDDVAGTDRWTGH